MNNNGVFYQHFDAVGVFVGSTPADLHPLDGSVLPAPFGATLDPVPEFGEHERPMRVGDAWVIKPDWCGYVYWTADRVQHRITEVGVVPPADALDADPGPSFDDNKARAITKTVDQLRAAEGTTDRALREIVGSGHPSYARMQSIEAAVAPLRARLAAINAATDQAQLDAATQTDQPA